MKTILSAWMPMEPGIFRILERNQKEAIQKELCFQPSSMRNNSECLPRIGLPLDVDYAVAETRNMDFR